jgi:hypothetical protein
MLRAFVVGLGALLLAAGAVGITFGCGPAMLGPLIFGALLLIGTVCEPHYKHGQTASPHDGFQRTGERFLDPSKNEFVEVWYNPTSGERRYVTPPAP